MGAKTWMIVYSNGDVVSALKNGASIDREATKSLLKKLYPSDNLEAIEDGNLGYTNPPRNIIYAGSFGDFSVIASQEFAGDLPSKVDARFLDFSISENIYLHAMHSVVDFFAFAKWEDGNLVRSLSLSPDSGVMEDIGGRLPFEVDFWDGKYPVVDPEDDFTDYPFVFHPLELGEAALKEFFGYQLEGCLDERLLDPEEVLLLGFRRKPWWKFW